MFRFESADERISIRAMDVCGGKNRSMKSMSSDRNQPEVLDLSMKSPANFWDDGRRNEKNDWDFDFTT